MRGGLSLKEYSEQLAYREKLHELAQQGKDVFIYGCGQMGTLIGKCLLQANIPFAGFVSRKEKQQGYLGMPVLSHEQLVENGGFLILPTIDHYDTALQRLKGYGFPEENILPFFNGKNALKSFWLESQYFDFPQFFQKGTAFVDGGCYDGATSKRFAQWCEGRYSKIFAFEPDPQNAQTCLKNAGVLPSFTLIEAGLGKEEQTCVFEASHSGVSCVLDQAPTSYDRGRSDSVDYVSVEIKALDSIVGEERIGFIKLDIEGSELDALRGAEQTILRDRPMCAISVYHKPGDVLTITDYLHSLVPEYRFYLRQYTASITETVLYAVHEKE